MSDGTLGRMVAVRDRPIPEQPRYHTVLFGICGAVGGIATIIAVTLFEVSFDGALTIFAIAGFGSVVAILGLADTLSINIDEKAPATRSTLEPAGLELTPTTLRVTSVAPAELDLLTLEVRVEGREVQLASGKTRVTLTDVRSPSEVADFVQKGIARAREVHGDGEAEVPAALRGLASERS